MSLGKCPFVWPFLDQLPREAAGVPPSILLHLQDGLSFPLASCPSTLKFCLPTHAGTWHPHSLAPFRLWAIVLLQLGPITSLLLLSADLFRTLTGGAESTPPPGILPLICTTAGVFKARVTSLSLPPSPSIACVHLRLPCEAGISVSDTHDSLPAAGSRTRPRHAQYGSSGPVS